MKRNSSVKENEMTLYFVNGSKQKKNIIESDFGEDIIDMIIDFFESHKRFPHILEIVDEADKLIIKINNSSEHFLIEDIDEENKKIIAETF